MDHMLYVAMSGAKQMLLSQAINTNNLVNANTPGFREDLALFESRPITGSGLPTRVNVVSVQKGFNADPGPLVETGRDLDVAIEGEGWIAVQSPDGGESYTRAGNLRVTSLGMLVTADGSPVLGNSGAPIAIPPAQKVEIGNDGSISVRPLGQTPQALAVIDRIKLVNPDIGSLYKGDDGKIRLRDGEAAVPDASVKLIKGSLEMSNVNAIDAMVNMIAIARQYEMSVKLMNTAKENDVASSQMLKLA